MLVNDLATLVGHIVLAPITIPSFLVKEGLNLIEEKSALCPAHGKGAVGRCVCGYLEYECCSDCNCM